MANDKERYLQKIKKLLNKARNNSSAEEAATAMRMAQKLMREYGLSESDISLSQITESGTHKTPSKAVKPPRYMIMLGGAICRAFGVRYYLSYDQTGRRTIVFYGPAERPEIACYAFEVLTRQLTSGRKAFYNSIHKRTKPAKKTDLADTWCEAWVHGVWLVITEFVPEENERQVMTQYMERKKEQTKFSDVSMRDSKKHTQSDGAARDGFHAGKKAKLSHGVSGSSVTPATIIHSREIAHG